MSEQLKRHLCRVFCSQALMAPKSIWSCYEKGLRFDSICILIVFLYHITVGKNEKNMNKYLLVILT